MSGLGKTMSGLEKLPEMSLQESVFRNQAGVLASCLKRYAQSGWCVNPAGEIAGNVAVLVGDNERLLVSTAFDEHAVPVGERHWWEYEPESLGLAWLMAHETLLEQLVDLTGQQWHFDRLLTRGEANLHARFCDSCQLFPSGYQDDQQSDQDTGYEQTHRMLFFRLLKEHRQSDVMLGLSGQTMLRLIQHQSDRAGRMSSLSDFPSLAHLALNLEIWLPPIYEAVSELDSYESGDLMLLDSLDKSRNDITIATRQRDWIAKAVYEHRQISVVSVLSHAREKTFSPHFSQESNSMNDHTTKPAGNDLSSLTAQLDFRVGEKRMRLDELEAIEPGSVLTLESKLDSAHTDIFVNGCKWADAQLIAVGDQLALQIRRIL
ncbi:MAG: hypothetical protein CSB48_08060 [Proteobacteria bacterium]|nr:MAG: hypothetical protein CSB48_08060 [Pseudomonadota bacterium]